MSQVTELPKWETQPAVVRQPEPISQRSKLCDGASLMVGGYLGKLGLHVYADDCAGGLSLDEQRRHGLPTILARVREIIPILEAMVAAEQAGEVGK